MSPPLLDDARRILSTIWGYDDFRGAQRRVILAALSGRDCLAVLPTGAGKSLCFQVPALLLPGLTVVVSPLIALMQDQVGALRTRGVTAGCLHSSQTPDEQKAIKHDLASGILKLLYVAPERLAFMTDLAPGVVSLLAVDESHCISEWGHDFRPHYRKLGMVRAHLGTPPTLAVTASATLATRADIITVLGLERPVSVVTSFDRPNLGFAVRRLTSEHERMSMLRCALESSDGTAVVYTPTRNRTDGVAAILRLWGYAAAPYHAGLPGDARRDLLCAFLAGQVRVMVATSAFGMGIDKADVRLVVHLGIPERPESYYQEAGRAGRDGKPATCLSLWLDRDLEFNEREEPTGAPGHRSAVTAGRATMRRYVLTRGCRRQVLLGYLGEALARCAGCDNCTIFPSCTARPIRS